MNKYKKVVAFLLMLTLLSSCGKSWLDINVDPNTPSNTVASVQSRLAWIQHYYLYAQGTAGTRAGFVTQQLTFVNSTASNSMIAGWNPIAGMSTTPYQLTH